MIKYLSYFYALLVIAYCRKQSNSLTYTVSGLSSGAFFAVQHGVAFSSSVTGIGVVAGGPYYCAQDLIVDALDACMTLPDEINVNTLVTKTKDFAQSNDIDDTSNIANQRVYLYSGLYDTVVKSGVVKKTEEYFIDFKATTYFQNNISSEHAMITDFYGSACPKLGDPYINNCEYDLAGVILQYIYNNDLPNAPVAHDKIPYNNVISIDQSKYFPTGKTASDLSLQKTAYAYIPSNCSIAPLSSSCRLHVVYHGCYQDLDTTYDSTTFNDTYVRKTGYNEWAESNDIVILYPQADKNELKDNPNGCWDWWGYDGKNYAWKTGDQLVTVVNMINMIFGN